MEQLTETDSNAGPESPGRRRALRNIAVLAFAPSLGGCGSSAAGPLIGAPDSRHGTVVRPEDFGAKGDGVSDDAEALQAALNSGKRVWLKRGSDWAFGSQLIVPTGSGFVGGGTLTMLTGTGKFDQSDFKKHYTTYAGLYLHSVSNVRIEASVKMQASPDIRTCHAVWVQNCSHIELDMEVWGFKEARFGIVEWNTNSGGHVRLNVHDCYVNSDTLPELQVTALSVDNNRLAGKNSKGLRFDVRAKDIYFGPAALAAYGYQTDGVNLQGSGYAGHSGKIVADNVHEPFDCFSDGNVVEVTARDCYWGVKLIHGASHNVIRATVDRYMKYALVYGGSSSPVVTKSVSYNRCYIAATRGGEIGGLGNVAAVGTDGPSATYKPQFNYTEVTASGDGINMDYIVHEEAGSNNTFVWGGKGFAIAAAIIQPTAGTGPKASTIRRAAPH